MTTPTTPSGPPEDNAKVVHRAGRQISWAWLFPIIAVAAALFLLTNQWKSRGPEIEILFEEAPGIQVGKTVLIYRGVRAGQVVDIHLGEELEQVVVKVRLLASASGLARQNTAFWIDQPVISLQGATGLESIIQGNSIQARIGDGPPAYRFTGLALSPLLPLEKAGLDLKLKAENVNAIDRGAPVYFRGAAVGRVRAQKVGVDGQPFVEAVIDTEHRSLVRTTSRFWTVPATSVSIGPGGLTMEFSGLDALIQGAVAFDHFDQPGEPADQTNTEFELLATKALAEACGESFVITFDDGRSIHAGQTPICYLGLPVGVVESAQPDPTTGEVRATVQLNQGFEKLRREGTVFTLVRAHISLQGVTGLETLLTGAYIAAVPGEGPLGVGPFIGRTMLEEEWNRAEANREGLTLTLKADEIVTLEPGAPVLYRGLVVGEIIEKTLDAEEDPVLRAVIHPGYRRAVASNARFWRMPATSVEAGPGVLRVNVPAWQALWQGGVAFDVFEKPEAAVAENTEFTLYPTAAAARAMSPPIRITFPAARGLLAGQSQLRYLGLPVGLVEDVRTTEGEVEVTARLDPGYDFLRRTGSSFSLVQAHISLQGVTGLETLISGVFIDCHPGTGVNTASSFIGKTEQDASVLADSPGIEVLLESTSTTVKPGAVVVYRDMQVGVITDKNLSADGDRIILTAKIDAPYGALLRENTRFWDAGGLRASLGFITLRIKSDTVMASAGRVGFATPPEPKMGGPIQPQHQFELHPAPRGEWQRWNPKIPLPAQLPDTK